MNVRPPPSIAWLVAAVGEEAACAFIESNAGQRIYIPGKGEGSKCAALYGDEIASALVQEWGGLRWDVPVCREWRILLYYCQSMPLSDIAARCGCNRSTVIRAIQARTPRHIKARERARGDDRQESLF